MAGQAGKVGAFPTPPAAPTKDLPSALPAKFSTDEKEISGKRSLREVALKSSGPIKGRSLSKGRR